MPERIEVVALQGLPEVSAGDDLAALLLASADLADGDVLAVSSKVLSKAAGLTAPLTERAHVVAADTVRVVAERRTPRGLAQVVESAAGPVMAAAGVDASNTLRDTVLSLPRDPDAAAAALRRSLRQIGAPLVAVVVTDTAGRAWRTGQTDFALGCAGLLVSEDLRGSVDAGGVLLEVTERAIADEVAAAADLVKGKASGVPAAVVRGLRQYVTEDDGPGARALLRGPASDWFRLGHVEAVRTALGVAPGSLAPPSVVREPLQERLSRAVEVATSRSPEVDVVVEGALVRVTSPSPFAIGFVTARLLAALWSEDLVGDLHGDGSVVVREVP